MRKLYLGVGIRDFTYPVSRRDGVNKVRCPYYIKWKSMMDRGYSTSWKTKHKSYVGVSVCIEWHSFMKFRAWMITQDWQGKELDKDILYPDNKIYSPDKCMFVTKKINTLLLDSFSSRGNLPVGVSFDKGSKKYRARVNYNGHTKNIGNFKTVAEAQTAYVIEKVKIITEAISKTDDERIRKGLKRHIEKLILSVAKKHL